MKKVIVVLLLSALVGCGSNAKERTEAVMEIAKQCDGRATVKAVANTFYGSITTSCEWDAGKP